MKNYLIKFHDKESISITEKEAEAIMKAIQGGGTHITIHGELFSCSAISKVEKKKTLGVNEPVTLMLEAPPNPVKKETIERLKKEMAARFNWK